MFDIGWQELFIAGLIALIVVGPKDLPRVLRTLTGMIRKVKGMAREFQSGIDEVVREAELQDMRKEIEAQGQDMTKGIADDMDPTGDLTGDLDFGKEQLDLEAAAKAQTEPDAPATDTPATDTPAADAPATSKKDG